MRPQTILTSPLKVFGGSEQARILHDPYTGCSHGDRGNFRSAFFPKDILQLVPSHPGGWSGGEYPGILALVHP